MTNFFGKKESKNKNNRFKSNDAQQSNSYNNKTFNIVVKPFTKTKFYRKG